MIFLVSSGIAMHHLFNLSMNPADLSTTQLETWQQNTQAAFIQLDLDSSHGISKFKSVCQVCNNSMKSNH